MSADLRWWWVRHAPVIGRRGQLYGQQDVACDTSDARAFAALAAALPQNALWITSPLSRARDTAAAILSARVATGPGGAVPAPSIIVPASSIIERDFSEQSFGAWAGFTWEEIAERDPAASKYFWADPVGLVPPGGESFAALMARVAAAIECMSAGRMGDVVAVAHGGVIRAAVAHALGLDAKSAMAVAVDNLSLTRLDRVAGGTLKGRGGPWRVVAVNRPPY